MSEKREITCDGCGEDLRFTGYAYEYRLALTSEPRGHYPEAGAVYNMGIPPAIDATKHFCNLQCLDVWRGSVPSEDGNQ